ncbi:hypothetical protein MLD38_024471 [Melastoma candidum]|uniref:Uncharacterized protein n=1 Tax=Melastoma candidum TaxID=119954 RepID=A0ACB9NSD9_9MYRT|nr:hypothetical protein MLD38_024471 [Melastoma candidum]
MDSHTQERTLILTVGEASLRKSEEHPHNTVGVEEVVQKVFVMEADGHLVGWSEVEDKEILQCGGPAAAEALENHLSVAAPGEMVEDTGVENEVDMDGEVVALREVDATAELKEVGIAGAGLELLDFEHDQAEKNTPPVGEQEGFVSEGTD